jgi:hypothetical protein
MSYAMQPPIAAAAPTTEPRRPVSVAFASILLIVMAVAGLAYAVATLAVAPGTVDRFRAAAGSGSADVDGYVTVVWIVAAFSVVLAVILFALFIVLALGLRRGSNAARIATWVVVGLGLVAGCGTTISMAVQRGGDDAQGTLGAALADAYPASWLGLNVVVSVAQVLGYLLVGVLLLTSPGTFFGRAPKALPPDPFAAPAPGGYPPPPAGYGSPPSAGYGPPAPGGWSAPPAGGYGSPYPSAPPAAGQPIPPGQPASPPQPGPDDEYWSRPSS